MNRKTLFLSYLLLTLPLLAVGQQHLQRAEKLLYFLITQQGDSIYAQAKEEDREILNPQMLNTLFVQLEKQLGKRQSISEWKAQSVEEDTVYYTDLEFEDAPARFLVSFHDDLTINRFAIVPVPSSKLSPVDPILMDSSRIEERPIEVVYDKYKLPGTFTLPKGQNDVPVVILVHGSGSQDRDVTIGPNKFFRDMAWGLAERGIASIRYDKRTLVYGEHFAPKGSMNYDTETCDDVLGVIKLIQEIDIIDKKQIYIIGHSLGGALVPRIAQRSGDALAGIIIAAGLARSFEDPLVEQVEYIASLRDPSERVSKQTEDLKEQVVNLKKMGTDSFSDSIPLPLGLPYDYWEFALQYKQLDVARQLSLPILVLQGERDYNVTMEDFALWRASLFRNSNVQFKSYPKLNHIFQ